MRPAADDAKEDLGTRLAPWLLALVFSHPLLLWPMIEGVAFDPAQDLIATGLDQPSGPLNMLFFPPLAAIGVWLQLRRNGRPWPPLHVALVTLLAFVAWAGMSALWSVEPDITNRRVVLFAFVMIAVAWPASMTRDAETAWRALFWVLFLTALINIWAVVTIPPTFLGYAGIYPHKNGLGKAAALMVLVAFWGLFAGRIGERLAALPLLSLGMTYLILSKSKTSLALAVLAPLLAAAATALARYFRLSPVLTIPLVFAGVAGVYFIGVWAWVWDFHAVAETLFGDPTLTLRTDIWRFAWDMAAERPWTGYGYEVFWGAGPNSPNQVRGEGFIRKMPQAHNGYLDIVVHLGLVGLALVIVLVLATMSQANRRSRGEAGVAFVQLMMIVFLLLYNLLEAAWLRSFAISAMVLLVLVGQTAVRMSTRRREPAQMPQRTSIATGAGRVKNSSSPLVPSSHM